MRRGFLLLSSSSSSSRRAGSRLALACGLGLVVGLAGCGAEESQAPATPDAPPAAESPAPPAAEAGPQTPETLPNALVLALAQFGPRQPGKPPVPLPATLEFVTRTGGEWKVTSLQEPASNVFHKAMRYADADGRESLLSAAGSVASLKLWTPSEAGPLANTLWEKDFGGKFSRMRDVEVADIFGDGRAVMVVATHDQGVVALVIPGAEGTWEVQEIDREPDTFVHEIEVGDLDGDGTLEVYATPSEPNRLDGRPQSGRVTRYVPARGEGRKVVADLGERHAKEIFVDDVDGDGRDELYVIVEGRIEKQGETSKLIDPVEIRRYDADTDPTQGVVIASIEDRLGRFLTSGDLDGDGKKELVAALFSTGVWLLRPNADPLATWSKEQVDADSGGFEHAAIIADLDEDGVGELYVASDNDSQLRRYVWHRGKLVREVIYDRTNGNSVFTWNIMPVPVGLVP
ncbi:MAG: VCBS repeat-containing protein [Deltaproteobacteria bacterium]|nr:VCBS repeat-containing protein [Deltaproteobacteria bacterium]